MPEESQEGLESKVKELRDQIEKKDCELEIYKLEEQIKTNKVIEKDQEIQ